MKINLGKRIKEFRKIRGLTQKQLAEKLGVTTITIQNYENNRREPNIETLKKIADALEVPMYDLITDNEIVEISRREIIQRDKIYSELRKLDDIVIDAKEKEVEFYFKQLKSLMEEHSKLLDSITENRKLEIINELYNDPIKLITFLIDYFTYDLMPNEKGYINKVDINKDEAINIINSLKNTLEFELYKIKNNKE